MGRKYHFHAENQQLNQVAHELGKESSQGHPFLMEILKVFLEEEIHLDLPNKKIHRLKDVA